MCVCSGDALETAQQALGAAVTSELDARRFPLVLGGGHEMAWGSFCGLAGHLAKASSQPRIGVVNFDAHFDLRRDTRGTSGTPFLQIAEDCAARGWPFRYACLGVSRYSNTEALFARAHELEVLWQFDESTSVAGTSPALAAFVADVEAVYLTVCLDVLPAAVAPGVSGPAARGVGLDVLEPLIDTVCAQREAAGRRHRGNQSALRYRRSHRGSRGALFARAHRQRSMRVQCDSLWTHVHLATMRSAADGREYGEIRDGGDRGARRSHRLDRTPMRTCRRACVRTARIDGAGAWITPGLIDCHTHIVYAGNRSDEFEARLNGASYAEIARAAAASCSTVRATRAATEEELLRASAAALRRAAGRRRDHAGDQVRLRPRPRDRARMLRVARRIGRDCRSPCARPSSARTRCRRNTPAAPTPTSTRSATRCCPRW